MSCQLPKKDDQPRNGTVLLEVTVMSFGYKQGPPPVANLVFDVRFLKNPFWVEDLRPLTGKDEPVQQYVLQQPLAAQFIDSVLSMLEVLLPQLEEQQLNDFSIAFGCTGGQHRSATMVEALASKIAERFPAYTVKKEHRELDGQEAPATNGETVAAAGAEPAAQTSGDELRGLG